MKLKYFKEKSYNELFDSVSDNIDKYNSMDTPWLDSFFNDSDYAKESKLNVILPQLYSKKNEDDIVDVRNIYNAFKGVITPKQASNELLWTYLTHTVYWDYVKTRWLRNEKGVDSIKARLFCNTSKSGRADRQGLLRNAVARLYWIGYLTYQENADNNKYELTEILLSKADLCVHVTERSFSMNKSIVIGILKAINDFNNNNKTPILEEEWRSLCKYINRQGAVMLLDMCTEDEIYIMSTEYLQGIRNNS